MIEMFENKCNGAVASGYSLKKILNNFIKTESYRNQNTQKQQNTYTIQILKIIFSIRPLYPQ